MIPLPTTNLLQTNKTINARDGRPGHQSPPARLSGPKVRRKVSGQAHEEVARAVDDHQARDELLVGRRRGQVEFKDGEGVERAHDRVDAEAEPDCAEDVGDDAQVPRLRVFGAWDGRHGGSFCRFLGGFWIWSW